MRKLAYVLLVLSFLVGCARLFTGVIYLSDEPTAILVLKRAPALWIECPETRDLTVSEQIVLDREEPSLFYEQIYLLLMNAASALAPILASTAILLLAHSVRRRVSKRS